MAIEIMNHGIEGRAVIKGTRIRVLDVGIEFEYLGLTPDEIVRAHPHLSLSQIHEALAYFYEHIREMQEKIRKDSDYIQKLKKEYPPKLPVAAQ